MINRRNVFIFLSICFLLFCYYAYYTYYVNMLSPDAPLLVKRYASSGLMNFDYEDYRSITNEIKLTNGLIYFVVFGLGYLFSSWSFHGMKQIGLVLTTYIGILIASGSILLLSSFLPGHLIIYRAGAEIKNFVWSPLFLVLIILLPRLITNIKNQSKEPI